MAGSWLGGSANALAAKDIFQPSPTSFSQAAAMDILIGSIWTGLLFVMIDKRKTINRWLRAESSTVDELQTSLAEMDRVNSRIPTSSDLMSVVCTGLIVVLLANGVGGALADGFASLNSDVIAYIAFDNLALWRTIVATFVGLLLSYSPVKQLEDVGASKVATVILYAVISIIGMEMDITTIADNPGIFLLGLFWICVHGAVLFAAAFIMKVPLFYAAISSMACVGGAASAPIVAAQFHPALAPCGALFAILGYLIGTLGAWASALMMEMAAPN